jgi:O-antigen ligase
VLSPRADVGPAAAVEWWRPSAPEADRPAAAAAVGREAPGGDVAFRALAVFTVILLLAPQGFIPALRPLRIALVAAVVAIAACLLDRARRGQPLTVRRREMALAGALVGWAVVTIPLSYWPGGTLSFLLDLYFKTVTIFWLLANVVDTMPRLQGIARLLTWISVPLALTGVKNFLTGAFIPAGHSVRRIGGYEAGLTANPNDLALMLNMILPLTIALVEVTRGTLARAVLISIALLQAACIVVTFSRAGFLTLATIATLYLWRLVRRGRALVAAAVVGGALCALPLVPGGYLDRLATIADPDADPTGSAQARWSDSVAALNFVLDHPFMGAGAGMNTLALNEVRGPAWMEVHNVYLEYAADLGLPGLALFLLLLRACWKRARAVRREAASVTELATLSILAGGIELALVGFAVAAFFYPVAYHAFFYYPAGLAVAAGVLFDQVRRGQDVPAGEWAS